MINIIFNRIVICGLLSSSIVLLGMDQAIIPNSPRPQTHQEHQAPQSSSSSSLIAKLEKIEEKVHAVGDVVLGGIIENPQIVAAGLSLVIGQPAAQTATPIIEQDAILIKKGIDAVDNFVQEYEKTHPQSSTNPNIERASSSQQPKNSQKQSDNNNHTLIIGGTVITLASILLLLYKYNYLPNIQQFFNKFASSQATT